MKTKRHILTAAIASALLLPVTARAGTDITTSNYVPGGYSAASGYLNSVIGAVCFAAGQQNGVYGSYNSIFGFNSVINNGSVASFSVGGGHNITGNFNFVTGYLNTVTAPGQSNFLLGTSNTAQGSNNSFIGGTNNISSGSQSFLFGKNLTDGGQNGSVMFTDSDPFGTGAGLVPSAADQFSASFSRGYYLFTDRGQGSNPLSGLVVVPSAPNAVGTSNLARVGINTLNPGALLSLGNSTPGLKLALYEFGGDQWGMGVVPGAMTFYASAGAERMRITSTGNIGIATTNPVGGRLHINQQTANTATLNLQGGEAENVTTPTRHGLSFSYFGNDVAKHFITTNHSAGTTGGNKMDFWLNTGAFNRTTDTPGNGTTRVMTLTGDGRVGIGISTPFRAALDVNAQSGSVFLSNSGFLLPGGVITNQANQNILNSSIYASGNITAFQVIAFSDERIKSIQGRSDGAADLRTLQGIEITDYRLKDIVTKGAGVHKKVIAQQVEKVYPQAVTRTTDVVPDIYKKAEFKDGWVKLATDLKVGERVRLIGEKIEGIHDVLEVSKDGFRTAFETEGKQVFVYGREVKDFRTVDYEAISMLNVSATQELARKLEAKDAEIAALKKQLAAQEAAVKAQKAAHAAQLSAIETRLSRLEQPEPAAVPVKLSLTK